MAKMLLVSSILSLLVLSVCASTIVFDINQESYCSVANGGCSFFNSSIWVGGVAPSTVDDITINGTNPASLLSIYFPSNSSSLFESLTVTNATFILQSNTSLNVASLFLGDASSFHTQYTSSFVSDNIYLTSYHGIANQEWDLGGYFVVNQVIYLLGDFKVRQNAYVELTYAFYYPSNIQVGGMLTILSLDVPHYASVSFPENTAVYNLIIEQNADVTVSSTLNIQSLNLAENSTLFLNQADAQIVGYSALGGNGTISATGSSLTVISNVTSTFSGSIVIENGDANFTNMILTGSLDLINQQSSLSGNGLVLSLESGVFVPGNLICFGKGINITNSTVNAIGGITVQTTLIVGQHAFLNIGDSLNGFNISFYPNAQLIVSGGFIMPGYPLYIPQNASLVSVSGANNTIEGPLSVDGTLIVDAEHSLSIDGNLILGTTSVLNARVKKDKYPIFMALGKLSIFGGTVQYEIKDHYSKSQQFPIIVCLSTITGSFSSKFATATEHSLVDRNLPIKIDADTVYLDYSFNLKDVQTWIWIVTGIAAAVFIVILIVVIAMCVVRRKRHNYSPVR